MGFIKCPNKPDSAVSLVLIDCRMNRDMIEALDRLDIAHIPILGSECLMEPVSSHPDLWIHHLGDNIIIHAPQLCESVKDSLKSCGFELIPGRSYLRSNYPYDIPYNILRIGRSAFHNRLYTDPVIMEYYDKMDINVFHVKQGYAKCSAAVIDEESIITSDRGIADEVRRQGFDVLLLTSQEQILLPGLNYGFIGGCSGLLSGEAVAFTGNIGFLSGCDEIQRFIHRKGKSIICLSEEPVIDFGSIIPLMENVK